MALKNAINLAALISALMSDIFDISQTVYDTLQTTKRGWDTKSYDFGDGRYISSGQANRDFRDKLNYAAMVTDYGLAEIFAGLLAATGTVQSASISLSSRGDLNLSAQIIAATQVMENRQVLTPSFAMQEVIYDVGLAKTFAELSKWGVSLSYGIKARVSSTATADVGPVLEAL